MIEIQKIGNAFKRCMLQGLFRREKQADYYSARPKLLRADLWRGFARHAWVDGISVMCFEYKPPPVSEMNYHECSTLLPLPEELKVFPHWHNWPCKCGRVVWRISV